MQQVSLHQLCSKLFMNGHVPNDLEREPHREPSHQTEPVRPVVWGHTVPLQGLESQMRAISALPGSAGEECCRCRSAAPLSCDNDAASIRLRL